MNILVTGGAGFIGSHLVKELLKQNHSVVVFDNLSSGKFSNLPSFSRHPGLPQPRLTRYRISNSKIHFIKGDILDKKLLNKLLPNTDAVYHLAAKVTVQNSFGNEKIYYQTNVEGTKLLLNLSQKYKIKKFIFASSAAVYGDQSQLPICEIAKTQPISILGKTKLQAEKYCREFKTKGLDTVILRFFNVYGPGQNPAFAGVVSHFIEDIKQNKKLQIYGDGTQIRDFVYIDDIVQACLLSLKKNTDDHYLFNIGTGKPISVMDVYRTISKLKTYKQKLLFKPSQVGDIKRSCACIHEAQKYLSYKPKFLLFKGFISLL